MAITIDATDSPETIDTKIAEGFAPVRGILAPFFDQAPKCSCGGPIVHLHMFGIDCGHVCWWCRKPAPVTDATEEGNDASL